MEIPQDYGEKFRRHARKIGDPRNQREEFIERFRVKLNEEQARDARPPLTYGRLAKRFENIGDSRLYHLFDECSCPEVRSFGAMLSYKLQNL